MFKSSFFFISFVILFTFCKKEYSGVCVNPGGSTVIFTEKNTKSKADKKCFEYYNDHFASTAMNETGCEIK